MNAGYTTLDINPVNLADEVIVNRKGGTGRLTVDMLAMQVWSRVGGPAHQTQSSLSADLDWAEGTLGTVWGDEDEALLGIYRKIDIAEAGSWERIGDLPVGVASAARIADAVDAEASERRAADLAITTALISSGSVFADVASGLAVVADGGTFIVAAPDGEGVMIYRRDGAFATEISTLRADAALARELTLAAELARDEAVAAAEFRVKNPNDFFSRATVYPIGAQVHADTGEVWGVVAAGIGDFSHPVSGIEVVIANDVTSATALGASDGADPSGRELFAPSLAASMQARKLYGVSMRGLLGRNYSPSKDAAAVLSAFLSELAPAGITITDPHRLTVLCEEPIRIVDNLKMHLGGTYFKKGFSASSAAASGLFSRSTWGTKTNDFDLRGFTAGAASSSQKGKLFAILGDRWNISDVRIDGYWGGQAFVFGGDDFSMSDITGGTPSTTFGTGFMRCLGGRNGLIHNCQDVYCGDDLFQFVPIGAADDPYFGADIDNVWYIGCTGWSGAARVAIAALESDDGPSGTVSSKILNSGWIACGGRGSNRSAGILNTDGNQGARQIDNLSMIGCSFDCSADVGPAPESVEISGNALGGIGRINFDKTRFEKTKKAVCLRTVFPAIEGAVLTLRDCIIEGESSAISTGASGYGELIIDGGRMSVVDQGGGNAAGMVVADNGLAKLTVRDTEVTGIASTRAAIRANHAAAKHDLRGITARKAAGATYTRLSSNVDGAIIYVESPRGTYDELDDGGNVRINPIAGVSNSVTRFETTQTLSQKFIGKTNLMQAGSAITLTVPTYATAPIQHATEITLLVTGAGGLTLAGAGVTFKGTTIIPAGGWCKLMRLSATSDTWIVQS